MTILVVLVLLTSQKRRELTPFHICKLQNKQSAQQMLSFFECWQKYQRSWYCQHLKKDPQSQRKDEGIAYITTRLTIIHHNNHTLS